MASPTTTILVAAILRSRASMRSRVMYTECGISKTVHSLREARHSIPHSAFRISHSWNPPFLLSPPLECDSPHPSSPACPSHMTGVADQVHAAVSRQHPAPVRHMPRNRQTQRARDDAGEDGGCRWIGADRRVGQVEVSLSLAQECHFWCEQDGGCHEARAQRGLVVVGEIAAGA